MNDLYKALNNFLYTDFIPTYLTVEFQKTTLALLCLFFGWIFTIVLFVLFLNISEVYIKHIPSETKSFLCKHTWMLSLLWIYTLCMAAYIQGAYITLSIYFWPLILLYMYILYKKRPQDFLFFYFKINGQVPLFLFFISISFCGALELVEITQCVYAINDKKQVLFLHPVYFIAEITGVKSYGITDQGEMVSYDPIDKSVLHRVQDGNDKTVLWPALEKEKNVPTLSEKFKSAVQEWKNRMSDTAIKKLECI